jgi:hypothetical protein
MVILGEVFHDANFVFQDGEQGNKLFIILAIADYDTPQKLYHELR